MPGREVDQFIHEPLQGLEVPSLHGIRPVEQSPERQVEAMELPAQRVLSSASRGLGAILVLLIGSSFTGSSDGPAPGGVASTVWGVSSQDSFLLCRATIVS